MSQRKINLFSTSGKVASDGLEGVTNMEDLRTRLRDLKIDLNNLLIVNLLLSFIFKESMLCSLTFLIPKYFFANSLPSNVNKLKVHVYGLFGI